MLGFTGVRSGYQAVTVTEVVGVANVRLMAVWKPTLVVLFSILVLLSLCRVCYVGSLEIVGQMKSVLG